MEGFRYDAHPMGMLVSVAAALSTFYPEAQNVDDPRVRMQQVVPADREGADDRRLVVPALEGPPVRLPGQRPRLRRELPLDDVPHRRAAVRRRPGARARARGAVHPARRPRAELLRERDAVDRLAQGRSVLALAGAAAALYGPLHGGANEAVLRMLDGDRQREERPGVHRAGQGRRGPPDGLRPPRLQELRPARAGSSSGSPTRSSR